MYIGKHEEGQAKLRKIIETAEDVKYKVNALVKLSEFYFQNTKLDEAEKCLKDAEEIDSTNPDVYYIRSQVWHDNILRYLSVDMIHISRIVAHYQQKLRGGDPRFEQGSRARARICLCYWSKALH